MYFENEMKNSKKIVLLISVMRLTRPTIKPLLPVTCEEQDLPGIFYLIVDLQDSFERAIFTVDRSNKYSHLYNKGTRF